MALATKGVRGDRHPRSPLRVVQIIRELSSAPGGLSLATLSAKLATPKTSLLNILRALEAEGYLRFDNSLYFLGFESIKLGMAISAGCRFPGVLKPMLKQLATTVGETCLIATLTHERAEILYSDIEESSNSLRYVVPLGTRRPLHLTAAGKLFLSSFDEDELRQFFKKTKLKAETESTITSEKALRSDIRRIAEAGISVSHGESVDGVDGIAAPVFGSTGEMVCALVVGFPSFRREAREAIIIETVRNAAVEMSQLLGFSNLATGGRP